jgi:hypothetical protein
MPNVSLQMWHPKAMKLETHFKLKDYLNIKVSYKYDHTFSEEHE